MRVLSIITKFPNYILDFNSRNPQVKSQSYEDQYKAWVNDSYGSFETWSEGLSKLGYQTERVYATVPELQKQWAEEQGLSYEESNWVESISKAQIKEYEPEILIISKQTTFSPGFVQNLRDEIPSIRLIIAWCCSPHKNTEIFKEYDLILSCSPEMVEDFKSKGHCCYYLKHSFDPRVLEKIDADRKPSIDFSFVGSVLLTPGYHLEREVLLAELVKTTDLKIWSPINRLSLKQEVKTSTIKFVNKLLHFSSRFDLLNDWIAKTSWLNRFSSKENPSFLPRNVDRNITRRVLSPVFGIEMYRKLRDSKVSLNTHGDIAAKSAANIRLFEATGVGTCLLTDWKENLKDLFQPDVEVVTYRNSNECIEKVRYLLTHENERRNIAEAGQIRTLKEHTIYHRAETLDEIIRTHLRKVISEVNKI